MADAWLGQSRLAKEVEEQLKLEMRVHLNEERRRAERPVPPMPSAVDGWQEWLQLMAIIEALTKTPSTTILTPFHDIYLKPELNSLQLWDQTSQIMLAQVVFLPDKHMQYQCHLYLNKEVVPIVLHSFANAFSLNMKSFLMFLQSYTQASRHSTTTLRYHHSQTRDVSNGLLH